MSEVLITNLREDPRYKQRVAWFEAPGDVQIELWRVNRVGYCIAAFLFVDNDVEPLRAVDVRGHDKAQRRFVREIATQYAGIHDMTTLGEVCY